MEEGRPTSLGMASSGSSRGVQLTEDGELLYSHVKSALQTLESAENQLRLRHELGMGQLRIGVSSTLCKYVLLPSLKDFVKLHPHLRVTITCQSTSHTLQMLEEGELDLGLTGKPERLGSLSFSPVMQIQDTFVAAKEYLDNFCRFAGQDGASPFASGSAGTLSLLDHGVLMLLDRENLTRQYLDVYLRENGLFPENICTPFFKIRPFCTAFLSVPSPPIRISCPSACPYRSLTDFLPCFFGGRARLQDFFAHRVLPYGRQCPAARQMAYHSARVRVTSA